MTARERCFIGTLLRIQVRRAVLGKAEMSVESVAICCQLPVCITDLTSLQSYFLILLHTSFIFCHLILSHHGGQRADGINFSSNGINFGKKTRPERMIWFCSTWAYTGVQPT